MANIANVINVALIPEGQLAARDNPNVCAVMTSEQGVLSTAERYRLYKSASDVAADFGTSSKMTAHANVFFAQQPNAVNFGGQFVAGYWRGASEAVAATSGYIKSKQLTEATVVSALQSISDGSFSITVDGGVAEEVTALDFRGVTSFADIIALIAVTGGTTTEANGYISITSATTGATSTVTVMSAAASGTFIGDILALSAGSGVTVVSGAASSVLTAETMVDALTALKSLVNYKGVSWIDEQTDADRKLIATWGQANSVLTYDVYDSANYLVVDPTNVVWDIKLSGLTNHRMLYRKDGDRTFATGYMARMHTVNFNAENSAITMHLKEIKGVAAEAFSQTEITSAYNVGLDIYTTIKLTPGILTSPTNDYTDNRYNIISYIDAVQTDMYNLIKLTGTKIPQTIKGVLQLIEQAEKTTKGYVRAGVFAPGTWSSPDTFGDIDTFNRNIEKNGFYWIAGALADQPQSDRQARKSPVLQGAVKNAGAIHSVDIIINFNL